ncbi:uncharacterized protein LOC123564746 [Mercenaria mercenaria]|uniref:uncharacterized protein LOC123564746 n=1 Tax=Mercenaria mercenaria TaxID=6596 RepID=UPI00234F8FEA|nr:uncharacterized protein LOC123564746 [Mercenaria mercenaria]
MQSALKANIIDPDQTARMVWIHAGRKATMLVSSRRGSNVSIKLVANYVGICLKSLGNIKELKPKFDVVKWLIIFIMFSVVVYILAILAVTNASLDKDFSCERYQDVHDAFKDCLKEHDVLDFTSMFQELWSDGVIEGDELYTELTVICSNREILEENITNCVERLVTDCPSLEEIVTGTIENKISFFCENNQPSSILSAALQHGYMFNGNCSLGGQHLLGEAMRTCATEAFSEAGVSGDRRNSTVDDVLSADLKFGRNWFQCGLAELRDELPVELECGSTVRDMLMSFAIFMSGNGYLTPTLTASDMVVFWNV